MERRRNSKNSVGKKPTERRGTLVDSTPILERLARIETLVSAHVGELERRIEILEERNAEFSKVRDEFIVMRAKWGVIAGSIGAVFAIVVNVIISVIERAVG